MPIFSSLCLKLYNEAPKPFHNHDHIAFAHSATFGIMSR